MKDIKSKMRSGVKVYVVIAFVPSEAESQYLDPDMSGARNFHRFPNSAGKIRLDFKNNLNLSLRKKLKASFIYCF